MSKHDDDNDLRISVAIFFLFLQTSGLGTALRGLSMQILSPAG